MVKLCGWQDQLILYQNIFYFIYKNFFLIFWKPWEKSYTGYTGTHEIDKRAYHSPELFQKMLLKIKKINVSRWLS